MPLVSIIIFCFNHELYIEQCILSILSQSYKNIDLTVIDDFSKDSSPDIIKRLSEIHHFKYYNSQSNFGWPNVINFAIPKYATGEYVSICAGDDYYSQYKISNQVKLLEDYSDYSVVYGNFYKVNSENIKIGEHVVKGRSGFIFDDLFLLKYRITLQTVLCRYNVWHDVLPIPENIITEDFYFNLKAAEKYKFLYSNEYYVYYRVSTISMSRNLNKMIDSVDLVYSRYTKNKLFTRGKSISNCFNIINLSNNNQRTKALKKLPSALLSLPKKIAFVSIISLLGFDVYKLKTLFLKLKSKNNSV